ncbi:hypothetical protein KAJ83_07025 [Marivibrio halodurans]|uniref:Uncharacterized protein n=1 Tax=Marivibrio halodurans TaxID=2039722 RepID=A0A8J7V1W2_9PROT|nr:hypothetical protein [Marivibrio halodurans]MBP5856755.1 hypothetical protein [Marivibrio halodurans]
MPNAAARAGRAVLSALALATLAGCSGLEHDPYFNPELMVRQAPMVAGNTYDRQNALQIIFPDSERINISYEYELDGEVSIDAPGMFGGSGWLYYDIQPSVPARFVILHLIESEEGYEIPRGDTLRLGQRRFYALDYCISGWHGDVEETADIEVDQAEPDGAETGGAESDRTAGSGIGPDPQIVPYLRKIEEEGYPLSRDIYVRRFIPRNADSGGRRTVIVVVRDITRDGYSCERIGDIRAPESESMTETISNFQKDASGSFEIMG